MEMNLTQLCDLDPMLDIRILEIKEETITKTTTEPIMKDVPVIVLSDGESESDEDFTIRFKRLDTHKLPFIPKTLIHESTDDDVANSTDVKDHYKNERYREDADRDHRHKSWRHREDTDREKKAWDIKRLKVDSDRKINNHGDSPIYDDRSARYKDNKDRKRDHNKKEELTDYRTRNIKNQYSESEKRCTSDAKIDHNSFEKGRPASPRSSPHGKFYPSKDHHTVSKQKETKYRDYVHEEGKSDKVPPRTREKIRQKNGIVIDGISLERHPRSNAGSSPMVEICHISPSSTSNERRHSNRHDVRRNLDAKEIGSRSVPSKDAKEYSDNHLGLGSSEDDISTLNNHNRRSSSDHNMGRPQNNWNNYPNWSQSPLPNTDFIPFHNVPPLIFNLVMQQFMPPMFGRPPMNMNNLGMPFPGHGNPEVWGNQVRESGPPPYPYTVGNQIIPDSMDLMDLLIGTI
nr:hypothetical protein [Tanacetum cinerariifolium]